MLIGNAMAKSKIEKSAICTPRVPSIKYYDAIDIAIKTVKKYLAIVDAYIDIIELNCLNNKYVWTIGFRRKAYGSGHLLIYVYMDGSSETSIGKDG